VKVSARRDDFWSAEFIPHQRTLTQRCRIISLTSPVFDVRRTDVRAPLIAAAPRCVRYEKLNVGQASRLPRVASRRQTSRPARASALDGQARRLTYVEPNPTEIEEDAFV